MNKVILIRHGETGKDKSNPDREIIPSAEKGLLDALTNFKNKIEDTAIVVCTDTVRAKQSAKIIANKLNTKYEVCEYKLRVEDINNLLLNKKELVNDFEELVEKYEDYQTLIVVGHGGAMEVIAEYQNEYKVDKMIRNLGYAEYLILEKNE